MDDLTPINVTIRRATQIAMAMLEPSNPEPTQTQRDLIKGTCELLLRAAFGGLDGRYIVGLPTGAGKSTCVAASIFALDEMGELENAPVMVLAEQIEAGRELLQLLKAGYGARSGRKEDEGTGIDESLISHVHGGSDGVEPSDADLTPICIATHKRSRMTKDVTRMLRYKGRTRGSWIDEGMLASTAFGLNITKALLMFERIRLEAEKSIEVSASRRLRQAESEERHRNFEKAKELRETAGEDEAEDLALRRWAVESSEITGNACAELTKRARIRKSRGDMRDPQVAVTLPEPDFNLDYAVKFVRKEGANDQADKVLEASKTAPESFTIIGSGGSHSVLQHRRVLPKEMDTNTVVLDAGADVDAIQLADPGLRRAEELDWWPRDEVTGEPLAAAQLKGWADVRLFHMHASAGKTSLKKRRFMLELIVSTADFIVKHAAPGDEVLVCTYKDCKDHLADELKRQLKRRLDYPVATDGDTKPAEGSLWLRIIHFGKHHSTNEYRDARIVIALGDFPISNDGLKALIIGQRNTMRSSGNPDRYIPGKDEMREGMAHWCSKSGLQLAGRGRARQVVNGRARAMIYAFVTDRPVMVTDLHEKAMPGSKLDKWEAPESVRERAENQQANLDVANAVRASGGAPRRAKDLILPRLSLFRDDGGDQLSMRQIRQKLNLPGPREGLSPKHLSQALDLLVEEVDWISEAVGADGKPLSPRTLHIEREFFW